MAEIIVQYVRTWQMNPAWLGGRFFRHGWIHGGMGEGIEIERDGDEEVSIHRVHVNNQQGEQKVGKTNREVI